MSVPLTTNEELIAVQRELIILQKKIISDKDIEIQKEKEDAVNNETQLYLYNQHYLKLLAALAMGTSGEVLHVAQETFNLIDEKINIHINPGKNGGYDISISERKQEG
jgi:hypothetical protein